ncbi:MAG: radical SAM protein [Clostridiales bacterium]|nr:radical SAM protein [Clostridiales bacterium]
MIVYGPVPSRRLGQSIGVNNIPPKTCSYSCVYCQIGRTNHMRIKRQSFYRPEEILREAVLKLRQLAAEQKHADYFSFVPNGEPTLDINLGETIRLLKPLGVKIAVISNASLLWMDSVKADLMSADWVSVSIDAADEATWLAISRPHRMLNHQTILNGILDFSKSFRGTLVTETMLVEGVNTQEACVEKIAEQIAAVRPEKAYLLVPTRPPAETYVSPASTGSLRKAVAIIQSISGADVECITGNEAEEGFFFTENIADDIVGIASVHPIREDIIDTLLQKRNKDRSVLTKLLQTGKLLEFTYEGKLFYRKNTKSN